MAITGVTSVATTIAQTLAEMRSKLDDLQRQLGTGEKSSDYAGLGPQRSLVVGLQAQLDASQGFDDTITRIGTRLSLAQTALTTINQSMQDVKHAAVQQNFTLGANGQTADQQTAQGTLDTILAALNTYDGSGYIFSGMSPDRMAVDSLSHILDGNGTQAGLKQIIDERRQADVGSGLGRLVLPAAAGSSVSLSEDNATSPFGLKLAGVSSTLTNTTVSGPSGSPQSIGVNFTANPAAGGTFTVTFTLPDGTTENVTLTATSSSTPAQNEFTIGATPAATAANFQATLSTAIGNVVNTSLVAASAIAAANNFFDTDSANPPQRVNGPPFSTATSLVDGTSSNTVMWYTGEAGASAARGTAIARVDPTMTVSFGMRANEDALRNVVKNTAVFAAMSFSASDPNASKQYDALASRLAVNFVPPQGAQTIQGLTTEIANAQVIANDAKDRHAQTSATLTDLLQNIENVSPDEIGTQLLALQTNLQASLQTTAMLSRLTLVNYLPS